MLLESRHEEILQRAGQLARPLHWHKLEEGYSYWVFDSEGAEQRVIRLSRRPLPNVLELKRAATYRATKSKEATTRDFSGSLEDVLAIIDDEIALIEAQTRADGRSKSTPFAVNVTKSTRRPRSAQRLATDDGYTALTPTVVDDGVDISQSLIYRWQIFDAAGELTGVYIGLARVSQGEVRFKRYRRRVKNMQLGLPYSTNPGADYRKVHYALTAAALSGARIVFTYLCNCPPGESLAALESRLIAEHDSFGPAAHQLNEHP
jgi:hypothetical protein